MTAPAVPAWLILFLATACALIVANIYYAQPLAGPISESIGLSAQAAGLIVTMAQVGYGVGLLFIVPLGDLVENRRLVVGIVSVGAVALAGAAASTHAGTFLAAAAVIGLGSCAVQILLPYAAHLAPEASRGRVVGTVTSGVMLGIMLARPAASFVTHALSWHAVFVASAGIMAALAVALRLVLPERRPAPGLRYGALLLSMLQLVRTTPLLRRRAVYQGCLFGAFSLFWTTTPLLLSREFHLSQAGIALFALVGVAGAVAAPVAGHLADRGWGRAATGIAIGLVMAAFLLARVGEPSGLPGSPGSGAPGSGAPGSLALVALVVAAILLDAGATASLVVGQRAVFSLGAAYRNRLNGLFMAMFFVGGAAGSAVGGWAYAAGGWRLAASIGLALPLVALLYFMTEWFGGRGGRSRPKSG